MNCGQKKKQKQKTQHYVNLKLLFAHYENLVRTHTMKTKRLKVTIAIVSRARKKFYVIERVVQHVQGALMLI